MHLFIEIAEDGIQSAVWSGNSIGQRHTVAFSSKTEPGYREALDTLLQHYGNLSGFENVTCSVAQTDFTLIPAPLFSVAEASNFLQFTTTTVIDSKETDYGRLNYFNCVGVYTVPSWIKSVLIPKFPRVVIAHERMHFLRKLEQLSAGVQQLTVIIHPKYALYAFVNKGNLEWQLSAVAENADDILYHLINAIERLGISTAGVTLYAAGTEAKQYTEELERKKDKIAAFQSVKWTVSNDSPLQFQLLCV